MKDLKLEDSAESITELQYEQFVSEFNLKLPNSYKEFILRNNGGYPEISAFGNPYEDGVFIENFNRISLEDEDISDELDEVYSSRTAIQDHQIEENNIPKHFYPFGLDDGGNDFCISMIAKDFGSIYILYQDGTAEEPTFLSSSFEDFIDKLEDPEKYEED